MTKNGQNPKKHVKKSISNTEYEPKNDKNHCGHPFSMVSIDSYTALTIISNFENRCMTLLCIVPYPDHQRCTRWIICLIEPLHICIQVFVLSTYGRKELKNFAIH